MSLANVLVMHGAATRSGDALKMRQLAILLLGLSLAGCSTMSRIVEVPLGWIGLSGEATPADAAIDAERLLAHTRTLASDTFEGRLPGTRGEDMTVAYLIERLRAMGVQGGMPNGSYTQSVSLVGLTAAADVGLEVGQRAIPLRLRDDIVINTDRVEKIVRVRKSPVVFVGYGVQAPEFGWDDYKGLDVRGKTLLMLVNDPPVPDPARPGELDPTVFKGRAMTYYGRWSYKYDIASKLGAAAVLVIHETGPAGYPWEVPAHGAGSESFTLASANGNSDRVPVQGWIRDIKLREILAAAGQDFDQLKLAAASRDFRPLSLPARASFQLRNRIREVESANVVGLVPGTTQPDEYIIFTAHWDHLGRDSSLNGDQIYNGAVDNAAGVAGLLELARHFAARPAARSLLFLAVTAEEQGLLGARHYARNPLYPLPRTLANFNMDGPNVWGRTRDVPLTGYGQSELEDLLFPAAAAQGRRVVQETEPERGYYYRSDHFEFAKVGVPSLFLSPLGGVEFLGPNAADALAARNGYIARDYHKLSDEVTGDWNLSGFVEDLELLAGVARQVAEAPQPPRWKPGSEFAQVRTSRHP